MNHLEVSQINFGLILSNRRTPQSYIADDFEYPFSDAVKYCQEHEDWSKEDLVKILAPTFIQDAEHAIVSLNGMGDSTDWAAILRDYAEDARLGEVLERSGKNLKKGKQVDYLTLSGHIQSRILKQSTGLTKLEDIDCENYQPFIKSGYHPIDSILGGIPADGPIVVYGLTGVGKSHWLANIMSKFLHEHKDKTGAIYTLEMGAEHWKWRETKMYKHLLEVNDRLHVSGSVGDIEQLVAEIATKNLSVVGIDDLDGLARENSAAEFERLYKKVKEVCRFMKIPVFVLAQPNRAAKLRGGFLGRYDVAWSGAAENSAAMLIALQRTNSLDLGDEDEVHMFETFDENHEYMIVWKSRDGWPGDYAEGGQVGPGAIILNQSKRLWEGEPIGEKWNDDYSKLLKPGTLWTPYSVKRMKKGKKS